MFGKHPFDRYSENDVRENIIRRLIEDKLGYPRKSITTTLKLKYEYLFLGHKKGRKKDRPLRGEIDYLMEVDKELHWVVEAKKPGEITDDDREQAFSYAMHPEIRAINFTVISGTHFEFYHTFHSPEKGPILAFTYEELEANFQAVYNLVSPEGLRRQRPNFKLDAGKPLAPGLRSYASVEGTLTYTDAPNIGENPTGMRVYLRGSVVRAPGGKITAIITPHFHSETLVEFSKVINATELEILTSDETISTNESAPTIFTQSREIMIEEGMAIPSFTSFVTTKPSPVSIRADSTATITGWLIGQKFIGQLEARSVVAGLGASIVLRGKVELTFQ